MPSRATLAGAAAAVVLAAGAVAAVATAPQASNSTAASCPTTTYDGSSLDIHCTVPQVTVTATGATVTVTAPMSSAPPTSTAPTGPPTTPPVDPPPSTTAPVAGFPDADSTGPRIAPAGTLTATSKGTGWAVSNGVLTITGANVTLQYLNIPFEVDIKAAGAKILDDTITTSGTGWAIGLYKGSAGAEIGYNLLQGPDNSAKHDGGYQQPVAGGLEYGVFDATGTYGGTATIEYNEFRYINHPLNITNGTVRENFMHAFSNPNGTQHTDAIFSGGGDKKPLTITHNTMINDRKDATAAVVLLSQAFGQQTNVTISNNLMAGGGFILYGAGTAFGSVKPSTNIVVKDNQISTQVYANGGSYGVFNVMPKSGSNGNVISGNTWLDGPNKGKPVS